MTGIEWTEATWNPIVGCSLVSPGCTNCYAMRQAARVERMNPVLTHYRGVTMPSKAGPVWTGKIGIAGDDALMQPLRRRKPTMWFVNSMSDLFHEDVSDAVIDRVFAVMALASRHTFQILTKRPERMCDYLSTNDVSLLDRWARAWGPGTFRMTQHEVEAHLSPFAPPAHRALYHAQQVHAPLPNVWLGVSVEDQKRADERIPILLDTPAAVRWISAEPLLGPVDLTRLFHAPVDFARGLDWVVVGGESGPGARPMPPDWARAIRDHCAAAGVPLFMKQMGGAVKSRLPPIPDDLMIRQYPEPAR